MTRRDAVESNHDNQYGAGYDAMVARNPPIIVWRLNSHGIWVHVSVIETERPRVPAQPRTRPGQSTHCRRRHEYTPENTYIKPDGTRSCRACKADLQRHERAVRRLRQEEEARHSNESLTNAARSEI